MIFHVFGNAPPKKSDKKCERPKHETRDRQLNFVMYGARVKNHVKSQCCKNIIKYNKNTQKCMVLYKQIFVFEREPLE